MTRYRGSRQSRGYGYAHELARKAALADLEAQPGQPCARCGRPMYVEQSLDLDHADDRESYLGLSHSHCNRSAGIRKRNDHQAEAERRRRELPQY